MYSPSPSSLTSAGLGRDAALIEIQKHKGAWFEPAVVDACFRLFSEKGFTLEPGK